jgi:DNA invertase Pin-like site-specific DNA recombinase
VRAAIYTRISRDTTGEAAGVDRQLRACTELAEQLDWDVAAVFSDNDISAYSGKTRPGFEALLDALKRSEVDALIVWHTDRLYRTLKDLVRLLDVAAEIRTVRSGEIDLSHATGRMVATILGSVSMNESEHHAERRREANRQRAVAGQWCATGIRPFGYDATGEPLKPEASLIRQAAKDVLGGRSLGSIAREWNAAGHRTVKGVAWTNLHVRRVLRNPRLAAQRVHQGTIIGPGTWEPILDENTWQRVLTVLDDPTRKKAAAFTRRYMGSGVYRCGICGNVLYAQYPHGRDRSMVYVCRPSAHVARNGARLDELVESIVIGYLTEQGVAGVKAKDGDADLSALSAQRQALVAEKDQLGTLFGRHVIDAVAFENATVELKGQIAVIDRQLAEATRISPVAALMGETDRNGQNDQLVDRWAAASPDIKSKIVRELFDVVVQPAPRGTGFNPDLIEIDWH